MRVQYLLWRAYTHGLVMTKKSTFDEAKEAVGQRRDGYNGPVNNFINTVNTYNALTESNMTVKQAVFFMLCLKLSREKFKHKHDNIVDLMGYSDCLNIVAEWEEQQKSFKDKKHGKRRNK